MNRQANEAALRADELAKEILGNGNTDEAPKEAAKTAEPTPSPQEELPEQDELEKLQHKYNVLKGKYESEIPRLHEQLRNVQQEDKGKVQQLEAQVAELNRKLQEAQASGEDSEKAEAWDSLVSEFGEDVVAKLQKLMPQQQAQQPVEPQPAEPAKKDEEDALFNERLSFVQYRVGGEAEFKRIDGDPDFNRWLGEPDPLYGSSRRDVMLGLFSAGKLNEAANFYITWRDQHEPSKQQEPDPKMNALEEQMQPGGRNVADPGEGKRIYKATELKAMLNDMSKRASYYSNTVEGRAEADALNKEINAAIAEGRVVDDYVGLPTPNFDPI